MFSSQLYYVPAVCHWEIHATSLILHFLTCNLEVGWGITPALPVLEGCL